MALDALTNPNASPAAATELPGLSFLSGAAPPQPQLASPPPVIQTEVEWEDLRNLVKDVALTPEQEAALVSDITAAIRSAEDGRRERMATILKVRNRYNLATPDRTPPFEEGANWHTPFMRWVLDAIHARLWGNAFGTTPWVMVSGVRGASDVELAASIEPFLQFTNGQQLHLDVTYDDLLPRVLTDGVVMLKVPWVRDVRRVRRRRLEERRVEVTEGGLPALNEQDRPIVRLIRSYVVDERDEVTYHGPRAEIVTIDNFVVPNPNISAVRDQPWCAQQFWMTRDQLWQQRVRTVTLDGAEERVGLYRNVESIVTPLRREDTEAHGLAAAAGVQEGVRTELGAVPNLVGEVRCYEIIWPLRAWWMARGFPTGDFDLLAERTIVTIAMDDAKLLRAVEYYLWDPAPDNYWVKVDVISSEGRFYSQALGEVLLPVQDELDTIHWQRTDVTTVMLLGFLTFLAEEGAADSLERLKLGQRNVVDSLDGVKLFSDVIKVAFQAPGLDVEQLVLKFGELLSAVAEPQLGSPTRGDKTAFEIGTLVREGNLKFTKMIVRLGTSIAAVDTIVLRRYAQFFPLVEPLIYRVSSESADAMRQLALDDLSFEPDLVLRGQTVAANREIEAAKAIRVLQLSEQSSWLRMFLLAHPDGVYQLVSTFLQQIDWPGGVEALIGKRNEAISNITRALTALQGAASVAGPTNARAQGDGNPGLNLAILRPIAQLLNDSGMAQELAAQGVQSTEAGT